MEEFPGEGWVRRIVIRLKQMRGMEISLHASHACFFMMLSVFPGLLLVVGFLRYTELRVEDLIALLEGSIPDALEPYIWRIVSDAFEKSSVGLLSLSAMMALWSSGRGILGLMRGLNSIYGVSDDRGWLRIRLTGMCYTLLFLLALIGTVVLYVFRRVVPWINWGFFAVVAVQTLLFTAMFMFLPNQRNGFRESLPGALFSSLGWMAFSGLFSVYVDHFNRYTNIYGSVYGVALAMLWLYMCVSIVFYGAVLNRFLKGNGKI